ncbi:17766_t:CDS:2 [Cetraspora pellucida]|uniref:17766_t:CDS:1 n=1 Tax=Cetraspora pellucida TaxID=1433469 RepID=A0A9N8WV43_9GLOM|nr:17766_t:CDS:2 [Cetraspora pellucida]
MTNIALIQVLIKGFIQEANQQSIQEDIQEAIQVAIQEPVQKAIQKPVKKNRDYIIQKADKRNIGNMTTKRWKELGLNNNCLKTNNLDDCITLCYDLEQYNPKEFREQEKLEIAVKKRAIAVHYAKVSKSYSDNRSDI